MNLAVTMGILESIFVRDPFKADGMIVSQDYVYEIWHCYVRRSEKGY